MDWSATQRRQDQLQGGDEDAGANRSLRWRPAQWPAPNQSRTPVGTALGCVIPRRPAPWDIGRPQPAIVRLASAGGFAGAVLDAGYGTGENALHVASLGLPVLGVDVAETALAIDREKARGRGIEVEFVAADALHLERLGRRFQTVLDCGLFHTFDGNERPVYVESLASVTYPAGTVYLLCFSDEGPDTGPHPISQKVLRAAVQPQQWMECCRNRAGLGRGTTPLLRRTGLVRDHQMDLDGST